MKKKECPSCAMEIDANEKVCPVCGFEYPEEKPTIKWIAIALVVMFLIYFLINFIRQ